MQLAQALKTEGFTFIALHPGARPVPAMAPECAAPVNCIINRHAQAAYQQCTAAGYVAR